MSTPNADLFAVEHNQDGSTICAQHATIQIVFEDHHLLANYLGSLKPRLKTEVSSRKIWGTKFHSPCPFWKLVTDVYPVLFIVAKKFPIGSDQSL